MEQKEHGYAWIVALWALPGEGKIARNLLLSILLMPLFASAADLKVGDRAPNFALPDQNGKVVKLGDFRGKKTVVLAFYIRASTPG